MKAQMDALVSESELLRRENNSLREDYLLALSRGTVDVSTGHVFFDCSCFRTFKRVLIIMKANGAEIFFFSFRKHSRNAKRNI